MRQAFLTFFIPFIYLLAILIILRTGSQINLIQRILGTIITFTGIFFWVLSLISLGRRSFAILPKAKELQTTGVYRYFRHPLYLGITLTLLGLSLAYGSKEGLAYTIFIIIPLNVLRARKEEEVLTAKFGQDYLDYKKRTII